MITQLLHGDCRQILKTLPDASVNCCVTSPPYWGLRDYGVDGQMGLEKTPNEYVDGMVEVFQQVRRVLRGDGTLWLNLGDSYATGAGKGRNDTNNKGNRGTETRETTCPNRMKLPGLKPKDLCGIPWRVAFALQADGWYLRQDIIWAKPNPMPESVTDRCTKSHEYVFLLSKSEQYYYDAVAIKEQAIDPAREQRCEGQNAYRGQAEIRPRGAVKKRKSQRRGEFNGETEAMAATGQNAFRAVTDTRNKRSVWIIATQPYKEAHFATFPRALITPMILAGCPAGGTVLDPFGGSGTTGEVSESLGRNSILIELNPTYIDLQKRRTAQMGM